MKIWGMAAIAALSLAIVGCNKQTVECTASSGQEPVITIVKEALEKAIAKTLRSEGKTPASLSKIRAAIGELVISIADVRTSKEDPNSTKRFCTGTLKIRFPTDVLADADKAREAVELGSVSDLADNADIERQADNFTTAIDFNIQPTDAGDKVFAETESGDNMIGFAAEVLSSGLMRSAVEDAQRQQQQAQSAQAAAETAALAEQSAATVESAKTENQLATQTISATWKAVPADTRARLLPLQRAWIRKKDADCRVEAASASLVPAEIEVARLGCDTRITNERINWLQQYRTTEMPTVSDEEPVAENM